MPVVGLVVGFHRGCAISVYEEGLNRLSRVLQIYWVILGALGGVEPWFGELGHNMRCVGAQKFVLIDREKEVEGEVDTYPLRYRRRCSDKLKYILRKRMQRLVYIFPQKKR